MMSEASKIEQVEKRFQQRLANPRAIEDYKSLTDTRGGKVLDVDVARWLCPEYAAGVEERKRWTGATSKPAAEFIKKLYEQKLKQEPVGYVLFLAGGGGSGKSTVTQGLLAEFLEGAEIVCDGTFARYDSARARVQAALDSGRPVTIAYVHRPFEAAVAGVAARYEMTGRWVPGRVLAMDHAGAQDAIDRLRQAYQGDDRIDFMAFDNSGEKAVEISMERLAELRYDVDGEGVKATAERLYPIAQEGLPYDHE
jgi:hypothetical protein